jgi:hypothetical protein
MLTSITIPSNVRSIASFAFQGSGLTSITLPNSVDLIQSYAFADLSNLTSVTLGNSLEVIEWDAFGWSSNLTTIVIPWSDIDVEQAGFANSSLQNIYFLSNAPSYALDFNTTNATVYYLPGTTGWSNFSALTGLQTVLLTKPCS